MSRAEWFDRKSDCVIDLGGESGLPSIALRTLGGPGSGNFGHAGRPGEVGGSAPSGGATGVLDAPTSAYDGNRELRSKLEARGFVVVDVMDLHPDLASGLPFDVDSKATLSKAAVEGIEVGLDEVRKFNTDLYTNMTLNVPVTIADYGEQASATTATGRSFHLFFNTNPQIRTDLLDPEYADNTIASKRAKALGVTGDDLIRESYHGIVVHEVGHLVDGVNNGNLSTAVALTAVARFPDYSLELGTKLSRDISPYGATGPNEAAAEIFAAAVLDQPLGEMFQPIRDVVLNLKDKR